MKTSSLPPKNAAKAGSETRTAFAAACALYIPCLTLAVWGASLAPASSSVGAEGIMLAVAQFESAAAAPATAAEPAAVPDPKPEPAAELEPEQAAEPELKPEPEPRLEPEPEPEPQPEPIPEPVEVVKPVRKVTVARRPPEKRPEAKRPDRPRRPHAPEVAAPVPVAPAVAAAPAAAPAEPALLVVGRDGDPFLGEVREAVLSTLECPREARRMRRQGTVTVQFVIGPDGCVSGISVHEGSGHDMLDREACAAVARAASLWGSPGRTVRIRMPVVFTLKKGRG